MRRHLLSILVVGLSLTLAGAANAGGKHGSTSHSSSGSHKYTSNHHDSHEIHRDSFRSYKDKDHFYWSSRIWYPKCGCYCYWEPTCACYYYWCVPDACYYPVSYCPYGKYCW